MIWSCPNKKCFIRATGYARNTPVGALPLTYQFGQRPQVAPVGGHTCITAGE